MAGTAQLMATRLTVDATSDGGAFDSGSATPGVQRLRRARMFGPRCPDCGGPLVHGEGCRLCPICGHSSCG